MVDVQANIKVHSKLGRAMADVLAPIGELLPKYSEPAYSYVRGSK